MAELTMNFHRTIIRGFLYGPYLLHKISGTGTFGRCGASYLEDYIPKGDNPLHGRFLSMLEDSIWPLTRMQSGQSGIVAEILGGLGLVNRLDALGLRPGRRITKISSMLMRGPITVQVDRTEIAIGFGIARKVLVRLE